MNTHIRTSYKQMIIGLVITAVFAANPALAADEYSIDAAHSSVGFAVKHMVISTVKGSFADVSGVIMYDENDVTKSSVDVVIKAASVNTNNRLRDGIIFFNFRGDRPRELTRTFVDPDFKEFVRPTLPDVCFVCMTEYDASIPAAVAFPKPPKMKNILAAYWSQLGLKQFRCAETEKYAHVTFFFNDYTEKPFPGEDRQIVPSPKVRTYDLKPEMSAFEVANVVLERLGSKQYDVVVINFANPDMVGHTGDLTAAIAAAEAVDECVGKVLDKIKSLGGCAIITADHGNFEKMTDGAPDSPHTAHTVGDVPLVVFDDRYKGQTLCEGGTLADIGPTLLAMMGLPQPEEMTGRSLLSQ